MAHQSPISGETLSQESLDSRSYAVAQTLSRVFHPILMNVCTLLIVGVFGVVPLSSGVGWALVSILTQAMPPTIFYIIRRRQGKFSDADVSVRQQRNELYLVTLGTLVVGTFALGALGLPRALLAAQLAGLVITVINGGINLVWKISAHATAIAITASVALVYSDWLGVTLWLCALAVGWARVRTRNHTPMQVLAGFLVAALVVTAVVRTLGQ